MARQLTAEIVSQLIRAERDMRKALDIFNSAMGEYPNGFRHNDSTFGLMIGRLASSGQFRAAESLLQRMDEEKCQCPEDIFITMCRAYGRAHIPKH
jgi:pentatricopeptide repeat protein